MKRLRAFFSKLWQLIRGLFSKNEEVGTVSSGEAAEGTEAQQVVVLDERGHERISKAISLWAEESNRLINWSFSVVAGSILTTIGTEFVRPSGWILYAYLLFIIGWVLLGASMYQGESISRNMIAHAFAESKDGNRIKKILTEVNDKFRKQLKFFKWGIFVFGLWLIAFLIWFVFYYQRTGDNEISKAVCPA